MTEATARSRVTRAVAAALAAVAVVTVGSGELPRGGTPARQLTRHELGALPATARGLVSRTLGESDRRFWALRLGSGWRAQNPVQGFGVAFTRRGVVVGSRGTSWSLGLRAVGRGARLAPVAAAVPSASANRVAFVRPGIEEWYANGPLGLEQSFTLADRPAADAAGPLTLAMALPRGLTARVAHSGQELLLGSLRYSGASAVDARGLSLPVWLQARSSRLLLRIDDRGARYPLHIDPLVQAAKLTASDGAANDGLGSSLAVSGDGSTIVAGAPSNNAGHGAVYVFVRQAGVWTSSTQAAKLTASDGAASDFLGSSVAISFDGSTVAASAPTATIGANTRQGAIYVFTRPGGGWTNATQTAKLTASDGAKDDFLGGEFGSGVSVSGNGSLVAAGVSEKAGTTLNPGVVYLFTRGSGWSNTTETRTFTASDGAADNQFGLTLAFSADGLTLVVGAPLTKIGANGAEGAAYVFEDENFVWKQTAKLTESDGALNDAFGWSVAISANGTGIVAGREIGGPVYVFVRPGITIFSHWSSETQQAKLTAPNGAASDFGYSVALSGDGATALAGALGTTVGTNSLQGAVYAFERPATGWLDSSRGVELTAPDGASGDRLGWSVAASDDGSIAAAGAPQAGIGSNAAQGAVYTFPALTATSVACQPSSLVVGHASACTATVSVTGPGHVTPTGSVAFATSAMGSFSGGGSCALAPSATVGIASCQVSYTPTAVTPGTHTITGSYDGDSSHQGSKGTSPLTVTRASTSTGVVCQPGSVVVGRTSACTATVTDSGSGIHLTPTGSVSFTTSAPGSFATSSCILAPTPTAGTASCVVSYTPSAVASGTHTITAAYGGDSNLSASQHAGTLSVTVAPTSTAVSCQPLTVIVGAVSTCTVTVTDTGSGNLAPAGSVSFASSAKGSFGASSCTLAPAAPPGVASCRVSYRPSAVGSGTHEITAHYGGDSNHSASEGAALLGVSTGPLPKVRIGRGKLVLQSGAVRVRLGCPGDVTFCKGNVSISTMKGRIRLGRAPFDLPGGKAKKVRIRLRKTVLAKLGKRRTTSVTLIARARDRSGRSATTKRKTTLVLGSR